MKNTYLLGVGAYIPDNIYTNRDICEALGFHPTRGAKYERLLGVRSRPICVDYRNGRKQIISCEELAYRAALDAMRRAQVSAAEIDVVICSSSFFDYMAPPLSSRLLKRLGVEHAMTFDLIGGCAEFLHGVHVADALIRSSEVRTVLVTASEVITAWWRQCRYPLEYFIFGDTGGAFVLSADQGSHRLRGSRMHTRSKIDGEPAELIRVPINGGKEVPELFYHDTAVDESVARLSDIPHEQRLLHNIKQVAFAAPRAMVEVTRELIAHEAVDPRECYLVPHQASVGVLNQLTETNIPQAQIGISLPERGNMSTASVPVTLAEHWHEAVAQPHLVCTSVGVGMSYGALVFDRMDGSA